MATDNYSDFRGGLESPSGDFETVTPSDSADLSKLSRAISWGGAGTLKVKNAEGNDVTIPQGALATGVMHSLRVQQVYATGTTATDIVAYY